MVGDRPLLRALDTVAGTLARAWPSLFGYQFLVDTLLDRTLVPAGAASALPSQ